MEMDQNPLSIQVIQTMMMNYSNLNNNMDKINGTEVYFAEVIQGNKQGVVRPVKLDWHQNNICNKGASFSKPLFIFVESFI